MRFPSSFSLSGDSCLTPSMWNSCEMRQGSQSGNANGWHWMVAAETGQAAGVVLCSGWWWVGGGSSV